MEEVGRNLFAHDFSEYRVPARSGDLRFGCFISHVGAVIINHAALPLRYKEEEEDASLKSLL